MDPVNTLRSYGLFDAKVPRYTSYPPANRFEVGVGAKMQRPWLTALNPDEPVSIYVHIPFCRRLCWFCACRTQGTKTLKPIEGYIDDLLVEIETVARLAPDGLKMARLHLGGGTPTLLTAELMQRLLETLFRCFPKADTFEFSVEIDPTEAAEEVLAVLYEWGMTRASVGVQDFRSEVQEAIGRIQDFDTTKRVIDHLRLGGVESLNIDLLYGLPYQTRASLLETLSQVVALKPDRLALYGYAHVPHVSKRQVMIPNESLPDAEARFGMAQEAGEQLRATGFLPLGIDHFARASDSLAQAAERGEMRRNFQGYTDDPCAVLLGFGASAISKFPGGYLQNTVATAAYRGRVQAEGLAGHKGVILSADDKLVSDLISALMCYGRIDLHAIMAQHPGLKTRAVMLTERLLAQFPDLVSFDGGALSLRPEMRSAARLVAGYLDVEIQEHHQHSIAI